MLGLEKVTCNPSLSYHSYDDMIIIWAVGNPLVLAVACSQWIMICNLLSSFLTTKVNEGCQIHLTPRVKMALKIS